MDSVIADKLKLVLQGHARYSSENLAFNLLIKKLQRKIEADPGCVDACLKEIDEFALKYEKIVATDFAKISAL